MGFTNALLAITSAGDEVIIPAPYYFNHEMAAIMANCRPVIVETDANYQLNIDAIKKAITDKTQPSSPFHPTTQLGSFILPKHSGKLTKYAASTISITSAMKLTNILLITGSNTVRPPLFPTAANIQFPCLPSPKPTVLRVGGSGIW